MSKQLAISAAFSTFAMAAFALLATPGAALSLPASNAGAPNAIEAPAYAGLVEAPAMPLLAD
jgi:hypothetical protein